MPPRPTALRSKRTATAPEQTAQPALGRVARVTAPGSVLVEFEDRPPIEARAALSITQEQLKEAAQLRMVAVILFERGSAERAILLDLVDDRDHPRPAALVTLQLPPNGVRKLDAVVDGKRVEITAEDEIVLRCGKASITLRRNGRVVVRGTHLETDSEGINRIKGSSVKIN